MSLLDNLPTIKKSLTHKSSRGIHSWRNRFDELHRVDGPALIREDSFRKDMLQIGQYFPKKEWYQNGLRHRTDGPAVVYDVRDAFLFATPLVEYWVRGKLHREDGPARLFSRGQEWWLKGELHRAKGPAVIRPVGDQLRPIYEYYQKGVLHRSNGPAVIYPEHQEKGVPLAEYWLEGDLFREDGPVVVWTDGESWKRYPKWGLAEISQ